MDALLFSSFSGAPYYRGCTWAKDMSTDSASTMALVTFLRAEADMADQRAKSLRFQAHQLAQTFGISTNVQQRYGRSSCLQKEYFCHSLQQF